jgi:amino acid permease
MQVNKFLFLVQVIGFLINTLCDLHTVLQRDNKSTMTSESATRSEEPAGLRSKSDVEKESYGTMPYALGGTEHRHVVADKLARKLSARQVQMIAIGKHPCHVYLESP